MASSLRDGNRESAFYLSLIEERVELAEMDLGSQELQRMLEYDKLAGAVLPSNAARMLLDAAAASYAAGQDRAEIVTYYKRFQSALLRSDKEYKRLNQRSSSEDINMASHRTFSRFVAFGEGLGLNKKQLGVLAQCIAPGVDQFTDTVLSAYHPNRPIHNILRSSSVCKPLIQLIGAPAEKQVALATKYLDKWEMYLKRDKRWPSHDRPTFDGYWCYELAAVVCAFGIDDSSFIGHKYYPGDLMSWRKN